PPLRADSPTLAVGLMKPAEILECKIEGTVAGQRAQTTITHKVPAPELQNFFLVHIVQQWKNGDKAAPAMIRADRGLALAAEQTRLARDEYLTQAHWALNLNKLDAAEKLFRNAQTLDPTDAESAAGLRVVDKLRNGQLNQKQLVDSGKAAREVTKISKDGDQVQVVKARVTEFGQEAPAAAPVTPPDQGNLLELEK